MLLPYRRSHPGWPLLATLGVHLLLAWSWRIAHPPVPALAPEGRTERLIELLALPAPAPALPRARPAPSQRASAAPRRPAPAPARVPERDEEEAVAPAVQAPAAADPFDDTAQPASPSVTAGDLLGTARREAGRIDRELRNGKPGIPDAPDTAWARFQGTLEGAHKDRGLGVTSQTYTAPDGQVIYRFMRGGKFRCRAGGGVRPKIGGAVGGGAELFDVRGGEGSAGEVRCPNHVEWKND
ncbi:hypothetical protein [Massilia sp. MS-15]|uniref:hypothetical protein n=1 Tax=Massilia sp. MS-15 TaxID=2878200 RepID=UPI001CD65451|nr:hypothetical protein [Massilia sp. MS-15]MCA1245764.1 hypothetical protein [Massilia sp. MS-15]